MITDDKRARLIAPGGTADRLLNARVAAGLSAAELSRKTGWTRDRTSKIENGRQMPSVDDVKTWAKVCELDDRATNLILSSREDDQATFLGWRGRSNVQAQFKALAETTTDLRLNAPTFIPGHLQTRAYATAVLKAIKTREGTESQAAIQEEIENRLSRGALVLNQTKRFRWIICEGVLNRWYCSPSDMLDQLDHIRTIAEAKNVEIRITPLRQQLKFPANVPFGIWDGHVLTEGASESRWPSGTPEANEYERTWTQLWRQALKGDKATAAIEQAIEATRTET